MIRDRRKNLDTIQIRHIAAGTELGESSVSRFFSTNPTTKRDTTFRKAMRIADWLGITLDELRAIVQE